MSKSCESACKTCRRESTKLFLKGDRCYTDKCAIDRRAYPPGQHGQARGKLSGYGVQLREKQKIRDMYGLQEAQFRKYFHEAERKKGITGETLLLDLEKRLDNVVYRLGLASSRNEARQLVIHGHVLVNGKRIDRPSLATKLNDKISIHEGSKKVARIQLSMDSVERRGIPSWLELQKDQFLGVVKGVPTRAELTMPMQEQLVVELYSK